MLRRPIIQDRLLGAEHPEPMNKKSRPLRLALAALYALLAVVAVAAIGLHAVYLGLHRSLPQTRGTLRLAGLEAPVEILRDQWGVPHIYAESRHDAVFAEGFAHAQDRLWQMETGRRLGRGRLAEILGTPALSIDRLMRSYDFAGLAHRLLPTLPPPTRAALEAYAAGVNAYLATHHPLPPEFALPGIAPPEPWTAEDSIILIKLMARQLSADGGELWNALLLARVSPEIFAALNPALPPLPALTALYDVPLPDTHAALPDALLGASNNWAVDGRWTKSGKPLLANDPHLGLTIPSTWYLAHLSFGSRDLIGASLAGVPGIILGRNDKLAWAYTNTGADVEDYYLEKLSPETPEHYISAEGVRPFTLRSETIKVQGAASVTETYRATAHGPVLPADLPQLKDLLPKGYVLALDWDALKEGDQTIAAGLGLMEAESGEAFQQALVPYVAPMQNMVYATADGHIGFIAPGHVPIRGPLNDTHGLVPAPGWKPGYDWTGIIPFAELPRRIDPPGGFIVTANNEIVGPSYPYRLTYRWDPGDRARRITALLTARRDHDTESFEAMQRDTVSLEARALLPRLLADLAPSGHRQTEAARLLAQWDGAMAAERPEPLIFAAWIEEIEHALLTTALGAQNENLAAGWRFDLIARVLDGAPAQSRFCGGAGDGVADGTACVRLIQEAFARALAHLAADQGDRIGLWRWGHAHQALMESRPLGSLPVLGRLLNRHIASDGGADTINRGLTPLTGPHPFANVHGSSYRAIYDMSEAGHSVFMISTGQSGNPLSRHYDDLMGLWARGAYIPMLTARVDIEAKGPERLSLLPAPPPQRER
jgi:penicillin G amidase